MNEEQFTEGFNQAYIMMEHDPQLAESVIKSMQESKHPQAQGFVAGTKEYEKYVKSKSFDKSKIPKNLDLTLSKQIKDRNAGKFKSNDKDLPDLER